MADNIISLGFNYDELTTEQKNVIALLDQVLDKTKQLNGIQMNPSTDGLAAFRDNVTQVNTLTTSLAASTPQLTNAINANNAAQIEAAKLAKAKADAMAAEERATQARARTTTQNTAAIRADARAAADASNDYKQLSLAYNDAALRAKNYALQLGDTHPLTVQAIADANVYGDRLRVLDASVGQFQRNVGNYSSALGGYANTLRGLRGPTKLLGEALGIGATQADQLRLILEHSLQGLAAFFRGKESAAAATEADTVAQNANTTSTTINNAATRSGATAQEGLAVATAQSSVAMRVFGTAMKITGVGLLIAGIVALVFAIKDMNKAAEIAAEAQNTLNSAIEESNGQYQKAVENVSELTINIDLAKRGFLDKKEVLKQYNDTIGLTTGKVGDLDEAEKALTKNGEAYVKMMLYKAAATLELDKAAKSIAAVEETRQKKDGEFANTIEDKFGANSFGNPSLSEQEEQGKKETLNRKIRREQAVKIDQDAANRSLDIAKDFQTKAAEIAKDNKFDFFGGAETDKPKKIKEAKDTSFEILENARKTSFELRQLRDKDVSDDLKRQSENKDNGTDQRIDALLEMGLKEQQIIIDQTEFEKNAVTRKLEFELTSEKHNQDEIIALKAKAVGDIAILNQKQSDESIKQGHAVVDSIKKLEDEASKSTKKEYDDTQKAAMSDLERKARIMEENNKAKAKKPKDAKEDTSVQDGEIDVAKQAQDTIFSFVEDRYEKEKNLIERKIAMLENATQTEIAGINASTLSNQEKAAQITIAEKTAASQTAALKRQQKEDDIKQAKFAKAEAALEIIENTAIAVMAALKLPGIGEARAIEIGAIGALQLATLAAKPIPQYATGINATPRDEWAITGEGKHPEIVHEPNKSPYIVNSATLSYLPKNTRVTPILDNAMQNLSDSAISNQFMNMAKLNGMMDLKIQLGENRMADRIVNGLATHLNEINGTFKKRQPINVRPIVDNSAFYTYKDSQTKR